MRACSTMDAAVDRESSFSSALSVKSWVRIASSKVFKGHSVALIQQVSDHWALIVNVIRRKPVVEFDAQQIPEKTRATR